MIERDGSSIARVPVQPPNGLRCLGVDVLRLAEPLMSIAQKAIEAESLSSYGAIRPVPNAESDLGYAFVLTASC